MAAICAHVRDQLEALVDGELGQDRAADVRSHLAVCAACRMHHAEATSLPSRLAAVGGPEPPPHLVAQVLSQVRRERVSPLGIWGPLAVELLLAVVALWYVSGLSGLSMLVERTVSDLSALAGWGAGDADLPAPAGGDVFLLMVCALLLVTTVVHLALLARQGWPEAGVGERPRKGRRLAPPDPPADEGGRGRRPAPPDPTAGEGGRYRPARRPRLDSLT
ncbi:MAG TPA: zf-HC2 domain-containing protein [Candidatus Dormibacteraeota bacterium]